MTPFYFGTRRRRLFGIYTPARAGAGTRAAVLCHPFGQEYLRAHRSMRQLGIMLNGAGYHVLRFDYFGSGDSAGELVEADLNGWEADIATAVDELRDTCDAPRVSLVGLRLGALLAARVAVRRKDVDELVMWDPIVSGARYVAELVHDVGQRPDFERPIPRPPSVGGGHEVLGFPLTEALAAEMSALELSASMPRLPKRTLLVTSNLAAHAAAAALPPRGDGSRPEVDCMESEPAWIKDEDGPPTIPARLLQRIVQWTSR